METQRTRKRNDRMTDARVKKGWTQPELARRAKVSITTINQAEMGRLVPQLLTQERIAAALGKERRDLWPEETAA
jgi:DNA-binding XRE family transcriptional regulator